MLVSTCSGLFTFFVSLGTYEFICTSCPVGKDGNEQKDAGQMQPHWCLGCCLFFAAFFCHARSNPAEMSLIMEVCRECLVGVLQFLFP